MKISSITELNDRIWYRMIKVFYILFFVVVLILGNLLLWGTFPQTRVSTYDLSKFIKDKYPDYLDVDNSLLVEKLIQKYPEFADKVSLSYSGSNENTTEYNNDWIIKNYLKDKSVSVDVRRNIANSLDNKELSPTEAVQGITQKYGNIYDTYNPSKFYSDSQIDDYVEQLKAKNATESDIETFKASAKQGQINVQNETVRGRQFLSEFFASKQNGINSAIWSFFMRLMLFNLILISIFEAVRRGFYYILLGDADPNKFYINLYNRILLGIGKKPL